MFKVRSLRRTQTAYVYIFVKLAFAIVVSYVIAFISLGIIRKLNNLSSGDDEGGVVVRWGSEGGNGRRDRPPFATILFWTRWFDEKPPIRDFDIKRCLPATCHVTTDRSMLRDADAIIFHSRDLDLHDLPTYRSPNQMWIFLTLESPFFSGIQIPIWRNISAYPGGLFNWTATYRRDSDIYCPYGAVRQVSNDQSLAKWEPYFEASHKNKSNRILWFAGNCHTLSNREVFVEKLKKLYPIDVFGPCGEQVAENEQQEKDQRKCNTRKNEMDCWRTLAQRYKYYLALENSFCRDYITEKFYRPLFYGLLPIVAGGHGTEDYKAIAPPKSFISAFDFGQAKDIAAFLKRLDANATLYESYFTWRRTHRVEFRNPLCVCEVCDRLLTHLGYKKGKDSDEQDNGGAKRGSSNKLIVVTPDMRTAVPPASRVSRWWHDGACAVP